MEHHEISKLLNDVILFQKIGSEQMIYQMVNILPTKT